MNFSSSLNFNPLELVQRTDWLFSLSCKSKQQKMVSSFSFSFSFHRRPTFSWSFFFFNLYFSSPYRSNNTTRSALERERERKKSSGPEISFHLLPWAASRVACTWHKRNERKKMEESQTREQQQKTRHRHVTIFPLVSLMTFPTNPFLSHTIELEQMVIIMCVFVTR